MRVLHRHCNHEFAAQRLGRIIAEAEAGDRPPRSAPLPRPAKQLRPDDVSQILSLWHETHNIAAIARGVNWDYGTVRKYLIAAGIDTAWRANPDERDDAIVQLHLEGKSTRQIARIVGCSHSKAWTTIRDYKA